MLVTNLCPRPNCTTPATTWLATATKTTSGLYTYTMTPGSSGTDATRTDGSVELFHITNADLTASLMVAVIEADSIPEDCRIGFGNMADQTELERTATRLVTLCNRGTGGQWGSKIYMWVHQGSPVTPRRAALYSKADWDTLQTLGLGLAWFDGDTMPLSA